MSNIGFGGVTDFAMTSTATAVRVMGVTGVGSSSETVQGTSLALNFVSAPTGYPVLDPRVTFSRASNATVTNSDGLIAYAPHNLLAYSEEFDNAAWTKNTATVTANAAVAPDGTATADLVTSTGADGYFGRGQSGLTGNQQFTASVYLRADANTSVRLYLLEAVGGSAVHFVNCDVTTVWQRFSVSFTVGAAVTALSTQVGGASSFGTGETVYAWGYQLNVGALQPYYTTSVKNLLGYTQEFDNAAWTKSNSFILTNLLTYSEQFDNAAWNKNASTVLANTIVSPDGTVDGDKLVEDTSTGGHYVFQNISGATSSAIYTASVFLKAAERSFAIFRTEGSWGVNGVTVNLSSGVASSATGTVTDISSFSVGNGWWRVSFAFTAAATTGAISVLTSTDGVYANRNYTGDGTSGIYIWGAQLVQGATAGDYQQTVATALPIQYSAPDGTLTAEKIQETAVTNYFAVSQNPSGVFSTPYTWSCYAKAGERNFLQVNFSVSGIIATFNLTTGATNVLAGSPVLTATDVGNGWWRCSATFTTPASGTNVLYHIIGIALSSTTTVYTGVAGYGIYIWGAQLSDSASLDPYVYNPVAAPAAAAYYGPRFDYDPVTLAPKGLLIEEQRTNLFTYSEQFDNAAWTKVNSSITANTIVAPDGALTGDKLVEDTTASSTHLITKSISFTSGTAYTYSIFAKQAEAGRYIQLSFPSSAFTSTLRGTFDLTNGTFQAAASATAAITSVGNGWYKCSITATATATASGTLGIFIANSSAATLAAVTYTGNGYSGIYIWGAQLEAGAFPTSYILTGASQVTRAADAASMIGANFSNWYNQSEGTLFAEFGPYGNGGASSNPGVVQIDDGTSNNLVRFFAGASVSPVFSVNSGGSGQAYISTGTLNPSVSSKVAGAYKVNDFARSFNGATAVLDTSGAVPVAVNRATIGLGNGGVGYLNGTISRIAYFPRRLSNAELQGITS
jgi:hypothetical protein